MKKKKKKSKIIRKILFLIIILLIICTGAFAYKTHTNGGGMQGLLATLVGNDKETLEELEPIQFLLLGVSTDLGGKVTDTIMVATYNPKEQTASLLSIPRDTYTGKDHSQGTPNEKINALEKMYEQTEEGMRTAETEKAKNSMEAKLNAIRYKIDELKTYAELIKVQIESKNNNKNIN